MTQTHSKVTASPLLPLESVSMATGGWCVEVQHPSPDVFHAEWLTLTHPLSCCPPAGLSLSSPLCVICLSVTSQQYYFFSAFSLCLCLTVPKHLTLPLVINPLQKDVLGA